MSKIVPPMRQIINDISRSLFSGAKIGSNTGAINST